MSHFFAFLRRMRFIKRWGLMRNTTTENIQEHSLEVAWIAHQLAILANTYHGGRYDANEVAVLAMYHEVSEIFTGDMPTPVKYFDKRMRSIYGEIEVAAQKKLLSTLPEALQPYYEPLLVEPERQEAYRLVKQADTLAAYMKCVAELHAGNHEFIEAHAHLQASLEAMDNPAVKQFVELYLPSLGLTLDQLNYTMEKE